MPKAKGAHREKVLRAIAVKKLGPGRHADGAGLYLEVDPSGARRWTLRTMVRGRRCDIGLGSATVVPLADARDRAARLRRIARDGGDPLAEKRLAAAPTFETAARQCYAERSNTWKNAKHRLQWLTSLEAYVFPRIGRQSVDHIETVDVLGVLQPIWKEKPETARRLRQRIRLVLEWAKAKGYRKTGSPTKEIGSVLPEQTDRQQHHPALHYDDVSSFFVKLSAHDSCAARALEFTILTATRTSEAIGAKWSEFDLLNRTWVIPAERMKSRREHRVPLSAATMSILRRQRAEAPEGALYVFPGRDPKHPLSNMAMLSVLQKQMGYGHITVHGFRSTFRDWAGECTATPNEVCEHALAHVVSDNTEKAYRRGDMFEKRRKLMDDWATYCMEPPIAQRRIA